MAIELEKAKQAQAKQDTRAKAAFGYAATSGGRALAVKYLPEVIQQVEVKLAGVSHSSSSDYELERVLRQLAPDVVGLVCLSGVLLATSRHGRYHTQVLTSVGRDLEEECFAAGLLRSDKKLAHRLNKAAAVRYGTAAQRRSAVRYMAEKANGFQMDVWEDTKRVEAGKWAFNIVMAALPGVFRWEVKDGMRYPTLSDAAVAEAEEAMRQMVALRPVWQPRYTCPPAWDSWQLRPSEEEGVRRAKLVKTYHKDAEVAVRAAVASGQAAPALKGLNALQSVPLRINTWILDVISRTKETSRALPAMDKVEATLHVSANDTMQLNRKNKANRTRLAADLETAERCAANGVLYIPMQFEWRTRVNSIPMFNFQRGEHIRALFEFKEGKPITEKGIHWLQIHLANCGDFDKVSKASFEDRLAWTEANMDRIRTAVADPEANDWWQDADCPFLFLAACKELVECNGNPAYVSHLPGAWDGACNGLQHLAAMTRGLEEGRYVNLTDNEKPLDIYQLVADAVAKMVDRDIDTKVEPMCKYANMLRAYGLNRNIVKRSVMTFCYGSKEFGMGNHIITDLMDAEQEKVIAGKTAKHPFGDDKEQQRAAARYIASHTYDAILQVVGKPAEAMKLFQDCAAKLAHECKVLSWVTPTGMPVINRYHEKELKTVQLWLHDGGVLNKLRAQVAVGSGGQVDKTRVKNGAAPNIVHACDASHLLLTAGACADEGIQLATVHDSYATHLCDTDRMLEILRGEFVRMYKEHDVLAEVLASAAKDFTGDKRRQLPPLPEKGTLDLNAVLQAKYAFA
jgi:DNA-directed RNA polymerase